MFAPTQKPTYFTVMVGAAWFQSAGMWSNETRKARVSPGLSGGARDVIACAVSRNTTWLSVSTNSS